MHRTDKYSQHSSVIWPVWLNGCVFVYELSGCGFKSRCSHSILELFGDHLEGNTRVMFHGKHVDTKCTVSSIIRGNHTGIFIILLENAQKFLESNLWFDTELDYDNSRNYVDISKLSKELDYAKAYARNLRIY